MKQSKPPAKSAVDPIEELAEPSHPTLWAAAVYAVATMLLAYPALVGRILMNPRSDQYLAGFAFRDFAAQSLRAGQGFPLWNPFLQGGLPYVGAMHGDIFYPTFLLRMIMPTDMALTWEFIIHLFLAGLFTFLFLRAWRLGFYAALIGGLAYMLSGSIAGYASPGHDGKLFVSTLLPAVLLLLTRGIRDGRRWTWGALAIAIGLAVLSPHPQLLQYLLLTAGAFALYLAFVGDEGRDRLPMSVAIRRLALAAGSVGLGALIGAIQYLPVFEYKPWSPRAAGHTWAVATSYSFPIEETINAYLPQFSGILDQYWGQNGIHLHSDYFGVIALILVGAAFGQSGARSFRRFWIVTGVIALLWAFGGHTPLFHLILAIVPGTKYFRAPSTIIYVTAFAAAVLAAIGAERILARRVGAKYAVGWGIVGGAVALLMSVGGYQMLVSLASNIIATNFDAAMKSQVLEAFGQRSEANASNAVLGAWRSFVFVAFGAGVIWAFAAGRLGRRTAAIALASLVALDLWSIERLYWIFAPPAATTFATDPAIEAIKADIAKAGEPGRALTLPAGSGIDPLDPAFRGDALMAHGVRIVQGYHGNELGIYQQLLSADSGRVILRPEFWRHENVRYLYTGVDDASLAPLSAQLGIGPFVRIAGPVRNAAGSMVYAYRLPMNNPAAWVVGGAVSASVPLVLPTIMDRRFDPTRAALIDTGSAIPTRDLLSIATASITARVTRDRPGHMMIDLSGPAPSGAVLVVSENYFPGWQATSGTTRLPTSRANFNLIGVGLTAGTLRVDLSFTSPAYERGKLITGLALLIAVGGLIAGLAVDRRRSVAAAAA